MLTYHHVATLTALRLANNSNISDLDIVETASGPVLITTTHRGNSLAYGLSDADTAATGVSRRDAPSTLGLYFAPCEMEVMERGGSTYLLYTGLQYSIQYAVPLGDNGKLNAFVSLFPPMSDDLVAIKAFEMGGVDYMLASRDGSTTMMMYQLSDTDAPVRLSETTPQAGQWEHGEYTDIEIITIGGATLAVASAPQSDLVAVFAVTASGLEMRGNISTQNLIGISAPNHVETVTTAHGSFMIITGGESDSLSVFRLSAAGGFGLTDHVVDSGLTRFQATTAIATVEMEGRAFIFVGGGDDGITVMTLDGQGRLITLAVIEDSDALALANVSAITAREIGGKIAVFVASATEVGVTQFSFDPGRLGISRVGTGRVEGTAQNDLLVGTGGSSVLIGGAGDDILVGREGVVSMQGGYGRDRFIPGHGTTLVTIHDFEPGYDILDLSELAFIRSIAQLKVLVTAQGAALVAGPLRIEIITSNGVSLRPGFFTNDMFNLAHYANNIDYSKLVDPVIPDPGAPSRPPVTHQPGGGYTDPTTPAPLNPGQPTLYGTGGNDRIFVPGGREFVFGGGGDDLVVGRWGRDTIMGGWGNDTLIGGFEDDILYGEQNNDTLMGQMGNDRLFGGNGHDHLIGGLGDDRMFGEDHNDRLEGQDGDDIMLGGAGNDFMDGGTGNDLLIGGPGADTLYGGDGHDILIALGENVRVFGGEGNDRIELGRGANIAYGEGGHDTVHGGDHADHINLGWGDDIGYGKWGWDVILGGSGNDRIFGEGGNDNLSGNDGDDRLHGGDGNDFLSGGVDNDLLLGQSGADTLDGGAGADTLDGGVDSDVLWGGADGDLLTGDYGADTLFGQTGRDTLWGGFGNDLLDGGDDNDVLYGEINHDQILGGFGDDLLNGGAGNDTLLGGPGHDTLMGEEGRNFLTGGMGRDVFVFLPGTGGPPEMRDVIIDFQSGQDLIDLRAFQGGLVWIGDGSFTGTGRPEVRFQQLPDRVTLVIDGDGDGGGDFLLDVGGDRVTVFDLLF